jgi:hypothetical protein
MFTFKQYVHTERQIVDRDTARNQSPEKDDPDVFWPSDDVATYTALITQIREEVFDDGIFVGCVWQASDGTWAVLDHERAHIYFGFATKEYACEFLEMRASIEKLYPPVEPIDLGWD